MRSHCILALLIALAAPAAAQSVAIGSPLPHADDALPSARGETATLRSVSGENGLVIVFWSNVCPWTERYTERLVSLARDYVPAGVGFAAVNANDSTRFPDEDVATMRLVADQAGFSFPYLIDRGSRLAGALGARNAPHVYFFDAAGVLRYEGAIDDSAADPSRIDQAYLRNAIDLALAGQPVDVQRTNALGCRINQAQ